MCSFLQTKTQRLERERNERVHGQQQHMSRAQPSADDKSKAKEMRGGMTAETRHLREESGRDDVLQKVSELQMILE